MNDKSLTHIKPQADYFSNIVYSHPVALLLIDSGPHFFLTHGKQPDSYFYLLLFSDKGSWSLKQNSNYMHEKDGLRGRE